MLTQGATPVVQVKAVKKPEFKGGFFVFLEVRLLTTLGNYLLEDNIPPDSDFRIRSILSQFEGLNVIRVDYTQDLNNLES